MKILLFQKAATLWKFFGNLWKFIIDLIVNISSQCAKEGRKTKFKSLEVREASSSHLKRPKIIMILWLFQVRIDRVDAPLCRASICLSVIFLWFPQKTTCLLPFIKSVRLSTVQSNLTLVLRGSNVMILSLKPQTWFTGVVWHAIVDGGSYFSQLERIRYLSWAWFWIWSILVLPFIVRKFVMEEWLAVSSS